MIPDIYISAAEVAQSSITNDGTISIEYPELLVTWILVGTVGLALGAVALVISERRIRANRAAEIARDTSASDETASSASSRVLSLV